MKKIAKFVGPLASLTPGTVGAVYELDPPLASEVSGPGGYAGVMVATRTEPGGPSGRTTMILGLDLLPKSGEARDYVANGRLSMSSIPDLNLIVQSGDPALLFTGADLTTTDQASALAALGYELEAAS